MRAARAEVGLPHRGDARLGERFLLEIEKRETLPELAAQLRGHAELLQPRGDDARNHRGRVLVMRRQQPGTCGLACRLAPFAVVVELADHARCAAALLPAIEFFLDLVFDQLALFLDHENLFQPIGEAPRALRLERPGHRHLVHAQADLARHTSVDAQVGERLHGVAERFSGGDDSQARARRIPHDAIQAVGAHVGERGVHLVVEQARFLLEDRIRPADVQAPLRQREIRGNDGLNALRIDIHRGARFDDVGDALERDPATRETAHRVAVQAEIEILLHVGGVEDRNAAGLEDVFALVRQRRGFCRVVVARKDQHAAMLGGAGGVGVLEHVAAAVHARPLAVPHAEYAVVLCAREQVQLLGAPDRRRREVLVHAGLEADVVPLEVLLRAREGLVEPPERRAPVARHEAGGIEAGGGVTVALQHQQADQRLRTGDEHAPRIERVFVLERNPGKRRGIDRCVHQCASCIRF